MAIDTASRQNGKATRKGRPLLFSLALIYAAIYALFVCPYDANKHHAVCKAFDRADSFRSQAIRYADALGQPYLEATQAIVYPYLDPLAPYYEAVESNLRPLIRRGDRLLNTKLKPQVENAKDSAVAAFVPIQKQLTAYYGQYATPFFARYRRGLDVIYAQYLQTHFTYAQKQALNLYRQFEPVYVSFRMKQVPKVQLYFRHNIQPALSNSLAASRNLYKHKLKPHAFRVTKALLDFFHAQVWPIIARFNSLYIRPQINRVSDKYFDRRARKIEQSIRSEVEERTSEIPQRVSTATRDAATLAASSSSVPSTIAIDDDDDFLQELRSEHPEDDRPYPTTETSSGQPESPPTLAPPSTASQSVEEKRKEILAKHSIFEDDIAKLGARQKAMLQERLSALRASTSEDVPLRFAPRLEALRIETAKYSNKLARYFKKLAQKQAEAKDDTSISEASVQTQVRDVEALTAKALSRMSKRADEIMDELDAYSKAYITREESASQKACDAVISLTGTAQEYLGGAYAWLDDVTVKDWARYHLLAKQETHWCADYRSLISSKDNPVTLQLEQIAADVEDLFDDFENDLTAASSQGIKRLKGNSLGMLQDSKEGVMNVRDSIAAIADQAVGSAKQVSESIAAAIESVAVSTSSQDSVENLSSTAADFVTSAASIAKSSFEDRIANPAANAQSAMNDVNIASEASTLIAAASQSIYNAAGVSPSPTDLSQSAASVHESLSSVVSDDVAGLPSVEDASEAIRQAFGSQLVPTDVLHTIESVYASAESAAASTSSVASQSVVGADAGLTAKVASLGDGDGQAATIAINEAAQSAQSDAESVKSAVASDHGASSLASKVLDTDVLHQAHATSLASRDQDPLLDVPRNVHDAYSAVSSATRSVKKAAGVQVEPENARDTARSIARAVSSDIGCLTSRAKGSLASER